MKKFLALFLAVLMVLGAVPVVTVFAWNKTATFPNGIAGLPVGNAQDVAPLASNPNMQPWRDHASPFTFDTTKYMPSKVNGRLPALGWNSWNAYQSNISEDTIKSVADSFIRLGLDKVGFEYVVIDDGAYNRSRLRAADGQLINDATRFPSGIPAMADYIHGLGLKFGMYSDVGTQTCNGLCQSSWGREDMDAMTLAQWGVDYIKYDYCNNPWAAAPNLAAPNIRSIRVTDSNDFSERLLAINDGVIGTGTLGYAHSVNTTSVTRNTTGEGYVAGLTNNTKANGTSGDITFTVNVPTAGIYGLSVEYAAASDSANRWLQADVNGVRVIDNKQPSTGSATTFVYNAPTEVILNAGTNTIRLYCEKRREIGLEQYAAFGDSIMKANAATGQDMVYSLCEWGDTCPWLWAWKVGDCWRTTPDITSYADSGIFVQSSGNNQGVLGAYNFNVILDEYAGLDKGWNDPDMLMVGVGNRSTRIPADDPATGRFTFNENESHFNLWCMMNSPLMLGNILPNVQVGDDVWKVLTNKDVIDLNQDPLGIQCKRVKIEMLGTGEARDPRVYLGDTAANTPLNVRFDYLAKPLANGDLAATILNLSNQTTASKASITIDELINGDSMYKVGIGSKMVDKEAFEAAEYYLVKDLGAKSKSEFIIAKDAPITAELIGHQSKTYRITPFELETFIQEIDAKFKMNDTYITTVRPGDISLEVAITTYAESVLDVNLFIALYKDGKLLAIETVKRALNLKMGVPGVVETPAISIPSGEDLSELTIKGFVWDGNMVPMRAALTLGEWTELTDLALGKTATSSSYINTDRPHFAVDGNTGTRWSSGYFNNEWLSVDLGALKEVSSVIINWEANYATSYNIQVSTTDNYDVSFRTVATKTGGTGGTETVEFAPVMARYVRLYCLTRAVTNQGFRLNQFKVLGRDNSEKDMPLAEGEMIDRTLYGGVISASSENTVSGREKERAFDQTRGSSWRLNAATGWLQFQFTKPYNITKYALVSSNTASTAPRDPKNWTLYGSNNGADWDVLDSRENEIFYGRGLKRIFEFENELKYAYYRIDITANNGDASMLELTELQLFECGPYPSWQLGPFVKLDEFNPILRANDDTFFCPVRQAEIKWTDLSLYNPGAIVKDGVIYMMYRAQDNTSYRTSRIGLAYSTDGVHFDRHPSPIVYPDGRYDNYEWRGGCEDPRVVESNGVYYMYYTAYDGSTARLLVASSTDLINWEKYGPAFYDAYNGAYRNLWSKAGSVVVEIIDGRQVAKKINGKYWMYFGEVPMYMATSDDLIHWEPIRNPGTTTLFQPMQYRKGNWDSYVNEPGPPAIWTEDGILLVYNGANDNPTGSNNSTGDPLLITRAYCPGQAMFDKNDPTKMLKRSQTYFLYPEKDYELEGLVNNVCFIEGLVHYNDVWFLYYGTADSRLAVAIYDPNSSFKPRELTDLALGKTVTSSSFINTDRPHLAVDGSTNTRWSSGYFNNEWLSVDLGSPKQVSSVVINWEANYAATYSIQVSTTGNYDADFMTVATKTGAGGIETVEFAPVTARYVRLYCLTRAVTNRGFQLTQFKVMGYDNKVKDMPLSEGEIIDRTLYGGVITASSENTVSGREKERAFDQARGTSWRLNAAAGWLQFRFPKPYNITKYALVSSNTASTAPRDPKNWILYGSNNGINWVQLDSRENEVFYTRGLKRIFEFENAQEYEYYRLDITANNGDASMLELTELQLFECGPYPSWQLGPFVKQDDVNPILRANDDTFFCPVRQAEIKWTDLSLYNPGAIVKDGVIYMMYRAQDNTSYRTSRIGLATSTDGVHFERYPHPIVYPDGRYDNYEWRGGCEDPRIVESQGVYYMYYTAYDGSTARLLVASSTDLINWQKYGPAFYDAYNGAYRNTWSKAGCVVVEIIDGRQVAKKINGKYWMYWGETPMYMATSDDLIHWEPIRNPGTTTLFQPMQYRKGNWDSYVNEGGPPAIWTEDGILLIYNGANDNPTGSNNSTGDPMLITRAYCPGQAMFDKDDPTKMLKRSQTYFMYPEKDYELEGLVNNVCFIEGLVNYNEQWFLYYGTADSRLAVAVFGEPPESLGRNIAKNRAAYHSSAANYSNTGHLVTDGILKTNRDVGNPIITAQYNDSTENQSAEYAFDGSPLMKYQTAHRPAWVQYQFPGNQKHTVYQYAITSGWYHTQNTQSYRNYEPADWTLYGVADDDSLVAVATVTGYSFGNTPSQRRVFDVTTPGAYKAYRLNVTTCRSGNTVAIAELEFMDAAGNSVMTPYKMQLDSCWISDTATSQYVYIDLGGESQFDTVRLFWDSTDYATRYDIQVSDDAVNWETVYSKETGTGGVELITFDMATAEYVRLLTRARSGSRYKLYEFEVYGTNDVKAVPKELPPPEADGRQFLTGGNWKLQRASEVDASGALISSAGYNDSNWVVATVPGTILVSYLNNGSIPDPTYGDQQLQVSDLFFTADFWYRDSFVIPAGKQGQKIWLNFNNINWKADVYFNGSKIGRIEGAFIRGKFDVTDLVNYGGDNYLAVYIYKNDNPGTITTQTASSTGNNGGLLGGDNPTIHASVGWDWTQTVRGRDIGIYGDVFLSYSGAVQLVDPWIVTNPSADYTSAELIIKTEVSNTTGAAVTAAVEGKIEPSGLTYSKEVTVPANSIVPVEITVTMPNPTLWWPNRYGDQFLYTNDMSLKTGGAVSNAKTFKFGVRKLTYKTTGTTAVYINDVRIYCSGGNWGMDEALLRCNTAEQYDIRVRLHKEANFTMIRNWVGMTGNEEFYNACDKYGILVFDDFWLANGPDGANPLDEAMFMKNAIDKIKVVRKHPSLALYCGRNEDTPPATLEAAMSAAVTQFDGTRRYYTTSASQTANAPMSGFGPYSIQSAGPPYYFNNNSGVNFHTERGMPNLPALESIKKMMPEKDLWPIGTVWGMHDFTTGSAQSCTSFINAATNSYGQYNNLEEFALRGQMVNYENHKALFEAPSVKGGCAMLMWMSQSAWPSMVWQTYDYYFDTNAGYFGCKTGNQPVNAIYNSSTSSSNNPTYNSIVVANNSGKDYTGLKLDVNCFDLSGKSINTQSAVFNLASDEVKTGLVGTPVTRAMTDTDINFIKTKVSDSEGNVLSENFYWMTLISGRDFRALQNLEKIPLATSCELEKKDGATNFYKATVTNFTKTPALMIRVKTLTDVTGQQVLPTYYSDNYFSLMPGESKQITIEFEDKYLFGEKPKFFIEGWNIRPAEFGQEIMPYYVSKMEFKKDGKSISTIDAGEISFVATLLACGDATLGFYPVIELYKNGELINTATGYQSIELKNGEIVTLETAKITVPLEGYATRYAEYTVKGYLLDGDKILIMPPIALGEWAPVNLALGKTATSDGVDSNDHLPQYAVDGDMSTRFSTANGNNHWFMVDLGAEYDVSRVVIVWETAYGSSYRIEYATETEPTNYVTAYSTTTGRGGTDNITFEPVKARYVRFYGVQRGSGNSWGFSFWEFEVYAS